MKNKKILKELYKEVKNIENESYLTEEEFERKHNIVLADETLLGKDWLSQEDEEAWKDL